jgi:hypothetical protein
LIVGATDLTRAQAAQDHLVEILANNPEVNGIGIMRAAGGYVLKVNVRTESARHSVPKEIDGVTVQVQTIGPIRKRQSA